MNLKKRLKSSLGFGVIAIALMLTSCGEDTVNAPPIINFSNTDPVVLDAGVSTTTIVGAIVANAGLNEVKIIKVTGSDELQLGAYTKFDATSIPLATSDDITYGISLELTDITENITIKFEVTDKDNQYVAKSIDIEAIALLEADAITLNAQANGPVSAGENESFLSISDSEKYALNDIFVTRASAAKIDVMFMRHTLLKAGEPDFSLRSPDQGGIATYFGDVGLNYPVDMNTTKLLKVTTELDWDNLTAADFNAAVAGVEEGIAKIENLDDGDIIAFLTEDGEKGLIHVVQIVDPGDVGERYMKSNIIIDYKVQL